VLLSFDLIAAPVSATLRDKDRRAGEGHRGGSGGLLPPGWD
jgi:hypothetical protein